MVSARGRASADVTERGVVLDLREGGGERRRGACSKQRRRGRWDINLRLTSGDEVSELRSMLLVISWIVNTIYVLLNILKSKLFR